MSNKINAVTESVKKANSAARELRLAGLGVISRVRNESGKLFAELVEEGESVQHRATSAVTSKVSQIQDEIRSRAKLRATVEQARTLVSDSASRVEQLLQKRLGEVLNFVGLPSKDELKALDTRVATLGREIRSIKPTRAKAA